MEKITDILFSEVITEAGEKLGRVFELRSAGEPEYGIGSTSREITEILYGRRGFLEMIGLRKTKPDSISIDRIRNMESGRIIVDNPNQRS
jgi:hypothetical protein